MVLLLADVRKLITAEDWFMPRGQRPPEAEDIDDPDWEW